MNITEKEFFKIKEQIDKIENQITIIRSILIQVCEENEREPNNCWYELFGEEIEKHPIYGEKEIEK